MRRTKSRANLTQITMPRCVNLNKVLTKMQGGGKALVQCPAGVAGVYPDCVCGDKSIFNSISNVCEPCSGGRVNRANKCACPVNLPAWDGKQCVALNAGVTAQCTYSANIIIKPDGTCTCESGFEYEATTKTCKLRDSARAWGVFAGAFVGTAVKAVLPTSRLVTVVGAVMMIPGVQESIQRFANNVKDAIRNRKEKFDDCIVVSSYTDNVGTPADSLKLSEDIGELLKDEIVANGIDESNVKMVGYGMERCEPWAACKEGPNATSCTACENDVCEGCRKVEIEIQPGKCK